MSLTKYKIETKVTVRFSDTDAMGHCNNARFFSFMEEGRVAYFQKMFPDADPSNQFERFPFIIADIQCSFKSPAFCGETLIVGLGVEKFGNKSFELDYEIIDEKSERLVATGKSVLVMYDYKKETTYAIPDDLKQRFKELES